MPQREDQRVNLPVAEVPREEQHTASLRREVPNALFALAFDRGEHLRARPRSEFEELEQQRAEMRECPSGKRTTLRGRPSGERACKIFDSDPAVRPVHDVREYADAPADDAHCGHWQRRHEIFHRASDSRFEAVTNSHAASPSRRRRAAASLAASHAAKRSDGSTTTSSGSTVHVGRALSGPPRATSDSIRTASFSVVITTCAPAPAAAWWMAWMSRAVNQ